MTKDKSAKEKSAVQNRGSGNINFGIAAIGDHATVSAGDVSLQVSPNNNDYDALARQLSILATALKQRASEGASVTPTSLKAIKDAKAAAVARNHAGILAALSRAGSTVLTIAEQIGCPLAVAFLESAMRLKS